MRKLFFLVSIFSLSFSAFADENTEYHLDQNTRASDFSKNFFGGTSVYDQAKYLDMGTVGLEVNSDLNCGQLDVKANIFGEFKNVQKQIEQMVPNKDNITGIMGSLSMISVCYAYPTICAELRHDFLSLKANLNLRAQACQAVDKYIDTQADKGAKELQAESQAACVSEHGGDPATALSDCQSKTGLGIRDFQSGLEKKFTTNKQKVLSSILKFSQMSDQKTYEFLASFLGEIEVQSDGYWQPIFQNGMLRPNDVVTQFLAQGVDGVCKNLSDIIGGKAATPSSIFDQSIYSTIKANVTQDDVLNIQDLNSGDKELACGALGKAIGKIAAQRTAAQGEAIVSSGLLNTAIPNSLRDEYRNRTENSFQALVKIIQSEQIPSVIDVRTAISKLAYATREKNKLIASKISQSKVSNAQEQSIIKSDCTDSLSCGEL